MSKLVEEHGLSLVAVFTEVIPQLNILGMEVISGVLALEHTSLEYLVETINVFRNCANSDYRFMQDLHFL